MVGFYHDRDKNPFSTVGKTLKIQPNSIVHLSQASCIFFLMQISIDLFYIGQCCTFVQSLLHFAVWSSCCKILLFCVNSIHFLFTDMGTKNHLKNLHTQDKDSTDFAMLFNLIIYFLLVIKLLIWPTTCY